MNADSALCVFVKTPGCSPVKTRLGKDLENQAAVGVYLLCLKRVRGLMEKVKERLDTRLDVYWAIAESEAKNDVLWNGFPRVLQGQGGLGQRLSNVHGQLAGKYKSLAFIGADSPFMDPAELSASIGRVSRGERVSEIMPTTDGGYSFVVFSSGIQAEIWESVAYSASSTFAETYEALKGFGGVGVLPEHWDIDSISDLRRAAEVDSDFAQFL